MNLNFNTAQLMIGFQLIQGQNLSNINTKLKCKLVLE